MRRAVARVAEKGGRARPALGLPGRASESRVTNGPPDRGAPGCGCAEAGAEGVRAGLRSPARPSPVGDATRPLCTQTVAGTRANARAFDPGARVAPDGPWAPAVVHLLPSVVHRRGAMPALLGSWCRPAQAARWAARLRLDAFSAGAPELRKAAEASRGACDPSWNAATRCGAEMRRAQGEPATFPGGDGDAGRTSFLCRCCRLHVRHCPWTDAGRAAPLTHLAGRGLVHARRQAERMFRWTMLSC